MFVFSKYNHLCKKYDSEEYLLYNFMTDALVECDVEITSRLSDIDRLTLDEIEFLRENGFIIQENYEEDDFLRLGNKLICTNSDMLSILIAPTMECNFNCPYCFEHHRTGFMSLSVQNEIIRFIENSIKENQHKHLFVYWFGGEPLLGIDIIEKMSKEILEITDKYGLKYSSAMSTNGYFLTQKNIDILEKCRLTRIQVTLDGMKELNDKTRVLVDGTGTFDIIINNLMQLRTGIKIYVRINLNKENQSEIAKVSDLIKKIKEKNDIDISTYGAHMSVYEYNNEDVDELELSIKEYSDVLKKNNIIGTNKNNNIRFSFCDAAKIYSYCFDEYGNMYKCWNDIGNDKYIYDNVINANARGIVNYTEKNALDYLVNSFPDECIGCKVLPICMGGCIKKRVIEKKKSCSPIKYNLDDYVNKKYFMEQGGEIDEIGN